jgi:hypothetical protein
LVHDVETQGSWADVDLSCSVGSQALSPARNGSERNGNATGSSGAIVITGRTERTQAVQKINKQICVQDALYVKNTKYGGDHSEGGGVSGAGESSRSNNSSCAELIGAGVPRLAKETLRDVS